jgi:hypothetical protein
LCNGQLPIDTHTDFVEIKLHPYYTRHNMTSGILNSFTSQSITCNIF